VYHRPERGGKGRGEKCTRMLSPSCPTESFSLPILVANRKGREGGKKRMEEGMLYFSVR